MIEMRRLHIVAAAASLAIGVSACGSDDDKLTGSAPSASTTPTTKSVKKPTGPTCATNVSGIVRSYDGKRGRIELTGLKDTDATFTKSKVIRGSVKKGDSVDLFFVGKPGMNGTARCVIGAEGD